MDVKLKQMADELNKAEAQLEKQKLSGACVDGMEVDMMPRHPRSPSVWSYGGGIG